MSHRANQRSALRHGIWLSLAHTRAGDLDEAVAAGRSALRRLLSVTSAQCVALLGDLRDDLVPHAPRTTAVRDLVHDIERHLA